MDLPYPYEDMSREELIGWLQDAAKLWLAHDGLWFQAIEAGADLDAAMAYDAAAWSRFSPIEARRIMMRLGIEPGGGIDALLRCLRHRLYAHLNEQEVVEYSDRRCVFRMKQCRVQAARQRRNLPDFPCKDVGKVEYESFARTVDPRLRVRCVACPPDPHPEDWFCSWEFTLED
jgi:hypothetical protein